MQKKKPLYIYKQSAVIPFIRDGENLWLMLITARNGKRWIIPKGGIEKNMTPSSSAAKEAFEEAGVEGSVYPFPVGEYRYKKRNATYQVQVFLFEIDKILPEWSESEFRKRKLILIEDTEKFIKNSDLKNIINGTVPILSHSQKPLTKTLCDDPLLKRSRKRLEQSRVPGNLDKKDQALIEQQQRNHIIQLQGELEMLRQLAEQRRFEIAKFQEKAEIEKVRADEAEKRALAIEQRAIDAETRALDAERKLFLFRRNIDSHRHDLRQMLTVMVNNDTGLTPSEPLNY